MTDDLRDRILSAAVICVGRSGLSRTSVDEVAKEAGVSRASVYRHFPGGRDDLLASTVEAEVWRFFYRLAQEVENEPSLAAVLENGLLFAHSELAHHEVFQRVLGTEPERLLPHLSMSAPMIIDALTRYLTPILATENLHDGFSAEQSAEYLARMVLSFIIGQGIWTLSDPDQVRTLVREQLLPGIVTTPQDQGSLVADGD